MMQRHLALSVAIALIAISLAANVSMVVHRMWPTYLFLLSSALGIAVLVAWIVARRDPASPFGRHVGSLSLLLVIASMATFVLATGVRHRRGYLVTWSQGANGVRLTFVDFPAFSMVIQSGQLARCLEAQHGRRLTGEFEITTDFGRPRGFSIISAGPCRVPPGAWSYAEQHSGPAPW